MTNRGPMLIIANPTSGRGRGRRTAEAVATKLHEASVHTLLYWTTGRGDAERMAKEAATRNQDRPPCVVACGGDGTIQEVANALASLRPALGDQCPAMGLAPAGRCNDFARALGISKNLSSITAALLDGIARPTDLGKVNGRYFCTVLTVGVDAEVSNFVDSMKMPLRGTSAYLYGALRVLARYRPKHLQLTGDFGTIDGPLFVASTANTPYYGGRIRIAPGAVATDGLLDLCLIDVVSRCRMLTLLPRVLLGRHAAQSEVKLIRTRSFTIESEQQMVLWADGERIAETPVEVGIDKSSIRVLVPPGAS